MDKYTATEQAYKNGYEKGYEAGRKSAKDTNVLTKADRIRAMSDEEMAILLADEIPHGDCYGCQLDCSTREGDKFNDSCYNAFYKWLKQLSEGNHG